MNKEEIKKQVIWMVAGIFCLTVLFFCWIWQIFQVQQKGLCAESFVLFEKGIQHEKKLKIKRQIGYYDPNDSPNDISREEKDAWCDQDYLISQDINRHVLDSLFHKLLQDHGLNTQTAIRYICNGKIVDTCSDSLFYQNALALTPIIYRIDENKNNNIMLQAYVRFSSIDVLSRSPLFIPVLCLWLLSLAGVIGIYYIVKRKRGQAPVVAPVVAPVQEQTICWIELPCCLFFDEKYGDLKCNEEVRIRLKDNSLRLFRCFVKAEEYKLTYEEITVTVLARPIKGERTKSDRDAVASTVSRLRDNLKTIPEIEINTIRNVGYQLCFKNIPQE